MGRIWAESGKSDSNLVDGSGDAQTLDLVGSGGGGGGTRVSAVGGGESRGQMRRREGGRTLRGGALLYAGEVRMNG